MPNIEAPVIGADEELKCGDCGTYEELQEKTAGGKLHRDHIPSKKALKERAEYWNGGKLSKAQAEAIEALAFTVAIPATSHRSISPTYGGRNKKNEGGKRRYQNDSDNLSDAAKRDVDAMIEHLEEVDKNCAKAYKKAVQELEEMTNDDYDEFLLNILNQV